MMFATVGVILHGIVATGMNDSSHAETKDHTRSEYKCTYQGEEHEEADHT